MKGRLTVYSVIAAFMLASGWSSPARAQSAQHIHPGQDQKSEFVKRVREATEKYRDVRVAKAAGYEAALGCVSGDAAGAMGQHYVNFPKVMDGELDPDDPEIVIYETTENGKLRLIGADYLVFAEAWDAKGIGTPQLGGQLFHYFGSPNRFGLDAFYTLHVWAWKDNPTGTFVNWHANVSCDRFSGQ